MKNRAKFCPNCGSSNIKWVNPQMWSLWICWDCGYQGPVVIEERELADEIKKEYQKRDIENKED
jgi:transcription factor S